MNPVVQALSLGYSATQVLGFISKAFPNLVPRIKQAKSQGHSIEQILGFLSKTMETDYPKGMSEQEIHQSNAKKQEMLTKKGLGGLAALGSYGLGAMIANNPAQGQIPPINQTAPPAPQIPPAQIPVPPTPAGQAAMQRAAPQLVGPGALPTQPQGTPPVPTTQPQSPIAPQNAPITPQNTPITPPNIQNPVNIESLRSEYQPLLNNIDKFLKQTNGDPKKTAEILHGMWPKESPALEKKIGHTFEEIATEYAKTTQNQSQEQPNIQPTGQKLDEAKEIKGTEEVIQHNYKPEKIQKAETIVIPDGDIGEVKEIRNGKAIVEVNGKKFQLKEEELEKPEFTNDEIADAYDDLMKKIPESQRSGFISWAGYDEDKNILGFIPRESGKYEELHNITPYEAKLIKEGNGVAWTGGGNREGIWAIGEDTRGGVISQIIHDRRRQKEAKEKEQLKFDFDLPKPEKEDKGMKIQFGEMEYARGLSREREKKAKLAERAEKKRLKEEEKQKKKNEAKKRKKQT